MEFDNGIPRVSTLFPFTSATHMLKGGRPPNTVSSYVTERFHTDGTPVMAAICALALRQRKERYKRRTVGNLAIIKESELEKIG